MQSESEDTPLQLLIRDYINQSTDDIFLNLADFDIIETLSSDNKSEVFKVKQKGVDIFYAAKSFNVNPNSAFELKKSNLSTIFKILFDSNNPSIPTLIGISPYDFSKEPKLTIITEYAQYGSLEDILQKERQKVYNFNFKSKKLIVIYGIAFAMKYLHSRFILHLKLTPRNILLNDSFHPKLSGLENCFSISCETPYIKSEIISEAPYIAPEVWESQEYTRASNVYAFSMILYEIITNKKPFSEFKDVDQIKEEVVNNDYRPHLTKTIPECYKKLIESCWSKNPKNRPTFVDIVAKIENDKDYILDDFDKDEYLNFIEFPYFKNIRKSIQEHLPSSSISNEDNSSRSDLYSQEEEEEYDKEEELDDDKEDKDKYLFSIIENLNINDIDSDKNGPNSFFNDAYLYFDASDSPKIKFNQYPFFDIRGFNEGEALDSEGFIKCNKIYDKNTHKELEARSFIYKQYDLKNFINFDNLINIIFQLDHPFLMKCFGYYPFNFKNEPRPVIITTPRSNVYLSDILKNKGEINNNWDSTQKLITIYEIASGMKYLHSHNIYIRTLCPANIFFDDNFYPKIDIFEFCIDLNKKQDETSKINIPISYYPPELFEGGDYTSKSEVYAFSMIVYEILTNKEPFKELSDYESIKKAVLNCERPHLEETISESYRVLLEKCWSSKAEERPTFDEIVELLKTDQCFIEAIENHEKYLEFIEKDKKIDSPASFEDNKFPIFELNLDTIVNISEYSKVNIIGEVNTTNIIKIKEVKTGLYFGARKLPIINNVFSKEQFILFYHRLNALSKIDHFSVLKIIGFSPFDVNNRPNPIVISEYATNGSLKNILENERKCNFEERWDITTMAVTIYGIASGMKYLHSHNIHNRALCPANIYFDDNFYPKIDIFDFCIDLNKKQDETSQINIPISYYPPELFEGGDYTSKSEVYAFSMIVYEILTNKEPFKELSDYESIKKAVLNCERPHLEETISESYRVLLEKCWSSKAEERPTFDEIVTLLSSDSSFITSYVDEQYFKNYVQSLDPTTFQVHTESIFKGKLDINNFEKIEAIGRGSFGKVCKVHEKSTGYFFAAKISRFENEIPKEEKLSIRREIKVMTKANHPSILKLYGYSPVNFKNKKKFTFIMDLAKIDLNTILMSERESNAPDGWNLTQKLIVIYGIASAMKYLHSLDIIHRDLKPANILLDEYLFPKVCDFGISKILHSYNIDHSNESSGNPKGTLAYMAPEALLYGIYAKAGDVYAFGIMVYEIIVGKRAWGNSTMAIVLVMKLLKNQRPLFTHPIPNCYRKLIEKCWLQDMYERPSFSEIVEYLGTNESFKEGIDVDAFLNYVKYVDGHLPPEIQRKIFTKFDDIDSLKKINYLELAPTVQFIDLSNYEKGKILGKGGFGKAYEVIDKRTNEIYAAKVSIDEFYILTKIEQLNYSREVNIMSAVKHESIIKFIGYSQFNFKGNPKPTYIMEYAKNGSLRKVINYEKQNFAKSDWNNTKKFINIYGIASIMKYLHSLDIIHRDLKSDNIILDEHLYPKLTDFGFSKRIFEHYEDTHLFLKGTPYYMAPEIYNGKYSKASDVFAYAMVLYEIVTTETKLGKFMSINQIMIEVLNKHYRPPMKKDIPECYKKLIQSCWAENPDDRPTFEEIVDKLKSDPSFMFDDVDLDEFMLYTEIIGDDYVTRNSLNKPQIKLEEDIKKVSLSISEDQINQNTINAFNKIFEDEVDDKTKSNFYLDINNYEIIELVKKGEFNKVYKVIEKRTGKIFAARISNIDMTEFSKEEMQTICKEFHRMSKIKHQSILRIIGFSPKDYKNRSNPVFITELTFKKSLQDVILNERKNIKNEGWDSTKKLINIYGIASGMKYLHSHGILHRNLKPSNILLDDLFRPKLSDFGFCNQLLIMNSVTLQSINKIHSSSCYQAPEVLNSEEYTKASDVYSFAIVAYEIITNDQPFINLYDYKNLLHEVVINGTRPKFNRQIPSCYCKLIESCWCQNPNERLTFDEIVDIIKNDSSFITSEINQREFYRYVDKDST